MNTSKGLFKSSSFWGLLLASLPQLEGLINSPALLGVLPPPLAHVLPLLGTALGLFGIVTRKKQISGLM